MDAVVQKIGELQPLPHLPTELFPGVAERHGFQRVPVRDIPARNLIPWGKIPAPCRPRCRYGENCVAYEQVSPVFLWASVDSPAHHASPGADTCRQDDIDCPNFPKYPTYVVGFTTTQDDALLVIGCLSCHRQGVACLFASESLWLLPVTDEPMDGSYLEDL